MRSPLPADKILNYLLLAAAFCEVGFTVAAVVEGYSPTPFADSWVVLLDYYRFNFRYPFTRLFVWHSEHRPLFASAASLADLFWAGGRGFLPLILIAIVQAGQCFLLWTIARKQAWFEDRHRAVTLALAIFCCFSPAQLENFLWTYQIVFVLAFFFATGAVAAIASQKECFSPRWVALVFLCSMAAPLCLACGVLVWWVVVGVSIAVRLPRKWILIYLAAAIATPIAYFHGYKQPVEHSDPLEAIRRPVEVAHYAVLYFGYAWRMWSPGLGELLTAAAIGLAAMRLLALARNQARPPWEVVPPAMMLFTFATAILTAMGRLKFGLEQAGSSRYQTPALLFWYMAALLGFQLLPKNSERSMVAVSALLLAAMLTPLAALPATLEKVRQVARWQDRIGAAWVSGVEDRAALEPIWKVMPLQKGFLERRLSVFGILPGSEMGHFVGRNGGGEIQPSTACDGTFTREAFLSSERWPGIRLKGSAHRTSDGTSIDRFVATDLNLQVIGVGAGGFVYASAKSAKDPLIVYGLLNDGQLCAIRTD